MHQQPSLTLTPVGVVHSPFKEKFGIPRQSGLAKDIFSTLTLHPPFNQPETVQSLSGFSHLWLIFGFHATSDRGWHPTVRPPRLGGNKRVGVFASRSTHRPNPIGLSVVKLESIDLQNGVVLTISGADLMDGTPVYDIKPYITFADSLPHAQSGYVDAPPVQAHIQYTPEAAIQLSLFQETRPQLSAVITAALGYDPRPAYQAKSQELNKTYGIHLMDLNIRWIYQQDQLIVTDISLV